MLRARNRKLSNIDDHFGKPTLGCLLDAEPVVRDCFYFVVHLVPSCVHRLAATRCGQLFVGKPKIELEKLRGFKDKVVTQLTGGLGQLAKQRKVTYIQGRAGFVDSNALRIEKKAGAGA